MSEQPPPPTSLSLQGKVAIVTGSSRGIGAELALDLARRGAKVVITYTSSSSDERAAKLVEEINLSHNGGGQKAICVKADLGELDSPRRIVEAAVDAFGPAIHILVNNAAVSVTKPLADLEVQDYDRVYNVNVRAVVLMTQACLPHLGPDSRVINLSSVGARAAFGGVSLYTSSKAALEGLTRAWAVELGRNGTTVNAVAPGPVQTDMLDTIPVDIVDRQKQDTPVGKRVGLPSEIANVVGWLAGPESGWVSGQVVNASGGWSMY